MENIQYFPFTTLFTFPPSVLVPLELTVHLSVNMKNRIDWKFSSQFLNILTYDVTYYATREINVA